MSEEQKIQEIVEFLRKHDRSYHLADDFDVELARETAKYDHVRSPLRNSLRGGAGEQKLPPERHPRLTSGARWS